MDNHAIARILREIADLLEIKDDNPFKIRAYRNGADIASNHPHALGQLTETELREIPGIGKDLAARIREIAQSGDAELHRELVAEFPPTILDLLHLPGVGPKTVAVLYRELGIRTLEDMETAARSGRVRSLHGMGPKKEALILKAIEERKRFAGRHLIAAAHDAADALIAYLRETAAEATIEPAGSVRRGCETVGDLDLLATNAPPSLVDRFTEYDRVERVISQGDRTAVIVLAGGMRAELRLVDSESYGAAMQYFTGSTAHNEALRERAITRGLQLTEHGVTRVRDQSRLPSAREEDVYAALGLDWIPPELRERRGEIDAAAAHTLPPLIERADLRGDVHVHTTESDGKDDIRAMARAAREAGLDYIAITDHSQSLAMANGLDEGRALAHADEIRAIDREGVGIRLLAGIECDIRLDGSMDLSDDCLAALDLVIASIHSGFNQDRRELTDRLLRAIAHPSVDIVGHPTGRIILKREPYDVDVEAVVDAAVRHGVALEINAQTYRLDVNDAHAYLARTRGASLVISTDAHSRTAFHRLRWGVLVARRAWLQASNVLNTLPFEAFRASLRRARS